MKKLIFVIFLLATSPAFAAAPAGAIQPPTAPEVQRALVANSAAHEELKRQEWQAKNDAVAQHRDLSAVEKQDFYIQHLQLEGCWLKLAKSVGEKTVFAEPGCMKFYPDYELNVEPQNELEENAPVEKPTL